MSDFDVIECGFNVADETMNFGSRVIGDGDQLFEARTLASIKQSDASQKLSNICILTISNQNKLCYAINKSIGIFADLSCKELYFNSLFDENIDDIYITPNSKYIFICLRNGTILYIDMKEQKTIFTEDLIVNNSLEERCFIKCFAHEELNDYIKFIIITKTGCVYRIILENENNDNWSISINLVKDFQFKVNTAAIIYPHLLVDGEKMAIYNVETDDIMQDESQNLLKVFPYSKEMFIGLDLEGNLIRICARTYLVFYTNNSILFKDFVYTTFTVGEHTKPVCVCISPENEIQFYDCYPILSNLKFSLKVPNNVHLVIPGSIDEECMYVSIIEKQDIIKELRIQLIYETAPEMRLKRLLRRQMFDEAERLAKSFNLTNTEVLKAKAQVIIDKTICTNDDVSNLLNIFNKIEEIPFILQSCLDIYQSCESLSDAQALLNYACNIVATHKISKEILKKHYIISDVMHRIDIFMLIQRLHKTSSDWLEFIECDLIELLCEHLQKCDIDSAILLYTQLDRHSKSKLNEHKIEMVLNILDSLPWNMYQSFLYCFIPLSLSYLPTTLPLFVKWLKHKVFFIEQNYSIEFPKNALEFMNNNLELIKVDNGNINFQQSTVHRDSTIQLVNLVKALKVLQLLRDNYQIKLPLKEYLKDPKSLIETLLTFNLSEELFDQFLGEFLNKFILENHLEPNEIFLDAIRNLIQYEENYWIKIIPSLLRNISSIELKLTAIISLTEIANEPWSQTMRDIVQSSLEYRHPLVERIRKRIEHAPLYEILMKPTYGLQDVIINSSWDIEYPIGRIIYCNESTMVNDIYQLCITSKDRHIANFMLANHFIKKRDYDRALEIIDNNSIQEIKQMCESIIHTIKLNDRLNLDSRNEPYLEMLQCLQRRWTNTEIGNENFKLSIHNILSCSQIRMTLYNKIRINDLECPRKKEVLLDRLLCNISESIADGIMNVPEALESCKKIAYFLSGSKGTTIIQLCEKFGNNFEMIKECASNFYNNEKDSEKLCLMVVIILRSVGLSMCPDPLNLTLGMNITLLEPLMNVKNQIKCLKIAQSLAAKAILYAKYHEINACVEVFNWAMSTIFTTIKSSSTDKIHFPHIRCPEIPLPSMGSLNCIKHIFNTYTAFCGTECNPDTRYLTYFDIATNKLSEDDFTSSIQRLPVMIKNFCLEGQTLTAFKLVTCFKNRMILNKNTSPIAIDILNNIIKDCKTQLLQKEFRETEINTEFLLNLLTSFELKEAVLFINSHLHIYKRHIDKFRTIAQIAIQILNFHQITVNKKFYVDLIQKSNWWSRKPDHPINIRNFFISSKEELLKSLIHYQQIDLKDINEYCNDFQMDVHHYYQIYLKESLVNWKPEYDKVENQYGKTIVNMKFKDIDLLERCMEVVNLLEDKEALCNFINSFKYEINFYHYEVYFVIFTILRNLNKNQDYKKQILLLHFLKTYKRVNKPSDNEIEEWYTLFPDTQTIDPLSQRRLPFTISLFTIDIWNIIRPELNLHTYNIWFEVIPILEKILNKNDICSYVIKQIVSSGILQRNCEKKWILYPVHNYLFEQVDVCAQEMTNLEMATSALYHLVKHTPPGADQVNAAKLCLKYAIRYKESRSESDPEVLKAFTKVQKRYISFAANHILHLCQINTENYVYLLSKPHELIDALYMDESILERAGGVLLNCPDINKAVDEIGSLFNINIHKARLTLLESWLSEKLVSNFNLTITNNCNEFDMIPTENLKRSAYICQSEDSSKWQAHLLKIGFGDSEAENIYYMANALNCFIVISDIATIETLTNTSFEAFCNYVNKMYLLSDLEYLGLTMDVETLNNYKKTDLLRRLAQNISSPITVKAMASLCMTYAEYDMKIWQLIIMSTLKLNCIQSLLKYVNFLKSEPFFRYTKFYISAWQTIIDQAFNISNINKKDVYESCVKNIHMIESCPTLININFYNAFNKCCDLRMYEFAAVITQYFPLEKQEELLKQISKNADNLRTAVRKLSKFGIWGTEQIQKLLETW